jgi:hypothetical protein
MLVVVYASGKQGPIDWPEIVQLLSGLLVFWYLCKPSEHFRNDSKFRRVDCHVLVLTQVVVISPMTVLIA